MEMWEKYKSPDVTLVNPAHSSGSTQDKVWIVRGSENLVDVFAHVAANTAPLVETPSGETLVRTSYRHKQIAPETWEITVHYDRDDQQQSQIAPATVPNDNSWQVQFSTVGGTAKIIRSLETVDKDEADSDDPAPDLKGLIGWNGKEAEGCEIIVPKMEFTITAYYPPGYVNQEFVLKLFRLTGKTNKYAWLGWQPGELLFLGADGVKEIPLASGTRAKPVPIQLKFAASENLTEIRVGDMLMEKKGWEYQWARYRLKQDGDVMVPTPVHAYVEKVYRDDDYRSVLGFGDAAA